MLYIRPMNTTTKNKNFLSIGLMSGTSADGVDAALIETDGQSYVEFKAFLYLPYEKEFQTSIVRAQTEDLPLIDFLRLEKAITEHHADAVNGLLQNEGLSADDIDVIGFHGQTVRHAPAEGITCQLGNASLLAHETGVPVVADFRRRDMAAGGEGAPLAPLFHEALLTEFEKPCAMVNIGGVSNITLLEGGKPAAAGDCGPGMGLVNDLVAKETNGAEQFDEDGKYALKGKVSESHVSAAMELEYFKRNLPKSADRHEFGAIDVSDLAFEDALATLCAITAEAIACCVNKGSEIKNVYLCGGGGLHPVVMQELKQRISGANIQLATEIGLRVDSMEAECFAWLAVRRLKDKELSLPSTTACTRGVSGGILTV